MNNATVISIFNSDKSKIDKIKTQHPQIMTTFTSRILKFKPMIKKPVVANHTFFTVIIFSRINLFIRLNQFCRNKTFTRPIYQKANLHKFQKDCLQDNLLFACL